MEKFYTVKEVAEALNVPYILITKWCREGHMKGFKIGRQWRISEKNFNLFIEESGK